MLQEHPVWIATAADIEEGIRIAASRYRDMDVAASTLWARKMIDHPSISILRTKNAVSCTTYDLAFWAPRSLVATMRFIVALPHSGWDSYWLAKAQIARAKRHGCVKFNLGSETGIDLGPFAKRLGFVQTGPNYERSL